MSLLFFFRQALRRAVGARYRLRASAATATVVRGGAARAQGARGAATSVTRMASRLSRCVVVAGVGRAAFLRGSVSHV